MKTDNRVPLRDLTPWDATLRFTRVKPEPEVPANAWMCNAIALLPGSVALNEPPDTVYVFPAQPVLFLGPAYTSQYVPSGSPVEKVVDHSPSSLLITMDPEDPRPNEIC